MAQNRGWWGHTVFDWLAGNSHTQTTERLLSDSLRCVVKANRHCHHRQLSSELRAVIFQSPSVEQAHPADKGARGQEGDHWGQLLRLFPPPLGSIKANYCGNGEKHQKKGKQGYSLNSYHLSLFSGKSNSGGDRNWDWSSGWKPFHGGGFFWAGNHMLTQLTRCSRSRCWLAGDCLLQFPTCFF